MSDTVRPTRGTRWLRLIIPPLVCFGLGFCTGLYITRDSLAATVCGLDNAPGSPAPHFAYVGDGEELHSYFVEEFASDSFRSRESTLLNIDMDPGVTYDITAVGIDNPDLGLFKFIVSATRTDEQHPEWCQLGLY